MDWLPCTVYVDGGYVRSRMLEAELSSSELNPKLPAEFVRKATIGARTLVADRIHYYDAVDYQAPEAEWKAQEDYLKRVERLDEVRVGTGYVRPGSKRRREQKAVDVLLSVDALEWAFSGKVGAIALVSGDADFAPLAEVIRRAGPYCIVLAFKDTLSEELADAADRVILLPTADENWVLKS